MPNPTKDNFSIQWTNQTHGKVQIILLDSQGKSLTMIIDRDFSKGEHFETVINIPSTPGLYFILGRIDGRTQFQKIIKI